MIVYLEGPDGAGKSTLKNSIIYYCMEKKFNIMSDAERMIPTHPREKDKRVNEEQLFKILEFMANDDRIYICDRGPISDCIYRLFDNYKPVTSLFRLNQLLNKLIIENKLLLISCRTKDSEQLMLARGDDNPVAIQHHKELEKLFEYSEQMYERVLKYDFKETPLVVVMSILELMYFCNKKVY